MYSKPSVFSTSTMKSEPGSSTVERIGFIVEGGRLGGEALGRLFG